MIYKETKSLFLKKYQYKIVLVCPAASLFRGGDFESTLKTLNDVDLAAEQAKPISWVTRLKDPEDLTLSKAICNDLKKMQDVDVRVESPWLSIYTNNAKDMALLVRHYEEHIKYVSRPSNPDSLSDGVVVMPKMDFDYKVTLSATKTEHSAFVQWASTNGKIKVTKSCARDLTKNRSWGGTHFYVTGDNNLLMAKMHLGGCIAKIQRIIKE